MKKVIAGLMMSATVLGLATFAASAVSVHAADDTTTAPITAAADGNASAENSASLNVEGGTLSFTQPGNVDFGSTKVDTVYNNGLDASDNKTSTTVSDFLGDKGTWTLSVSASGFGEAALDTDSKATVKLTPTIADGSAAGATVTPITLGTSSATAITGQAGVTTANLTYDLHIDQGTLVTTGTHTNTLTWNMANVPGNGAK